MCKPSQPPEGRGGTQNQTKLDSNLESSVSARAQSNSEWECTLAETELCEVKSNMCDYIVGSVVRKIISKKDSCELCKKDAHYNIRSSSSLQHQIQQLTATSDPAVYYNIRSSNSLQHQSQQLATTSDPAARCNIRSNSSLQHQLQQLTTTSDPAARYNIRSNIRSSSSLQHQIQ